MTNKKTAQMEILGLAIVVVLILVASIFVVRLSFNAPALYRKGFVSKAVADNMVNAFLRTTSAECRQLAMTELIKDCAQAGGENGIICENNQYSCKYVNETAKKIFSNTLAKWNFNYEFLIYLNQNHPLINLGSACRADKTSSSPWATPINSGLVVYTKLDICQ